jgi:NAD-dependent SIR2 family protein deacetylase
MNLGRYAKAIVAVIGAGITAALGIVAPDTDLYNILTVAAAMLTAASVYLVPNTGTNTVAGRHVA